MKRRSIMIILAAIMIFTACLTGCNQTNTEQEKHADYAIIAALSFEVDLIRDQMQDMTEIELLGTPAYEGTIGKKDVVVMQCGMGKVSAGIGTQALIDIYHPDYVINTGCAGGLGKGLQIGDIILSESVVEWDLDLMALGYPRGYIDALQTVEMKASTELCDKIENVIGQDANVTRGTVASGDQFVSTDEQRKIILDTFPEAKCAEMEGAAVGHVCVQNDTPFCIIRALSDTADSESSVDYGEFSEEASRKSAAWLVKMIEAE